MSPIIIPICFDEMVIEGNIQDKEALDSLNALHPLADHWGVYFFEELMFKLIVGQKEI